MTKIKSIYAWRYDYILRSVTDTEFDIVKNPLTVKEYDADGNLILSKDYGPGGTISNYFEYEYRDGKLAVQKIFSDENELGQTEYYEYDGQGKLVKTIVEYLDGSRDAIIHTYDKDGNKLSSITKDEEDDEEGQREYWEYENGLPVAYKLINDFGEIEEEEELIYNDRGQLIEQNVHNSLDNSRYTEKNTYNEAGQLVLWQRYNEKGKLIEEKSFEYDNKGRVIVEKTENAKSSLLRSRKYDDRGNEIYTREEEEDSEQPIFEVWREFDEDNQQSISKVVIYGDEQQAGSKYEVKYSYKFYE